MLEAVRAGAPELARTVQAAAQAAAPSGTTIVATIAAAAALSMIVLVAVFLAVTVLFAGFMVYRRRQKHYPPMLPVQLTAVPLNEYSASDDSDIDTL